MKAATDLRSFVAVGLLLGPSLSSYQLKENSDLLAVLLVILAGIFVFYAGEYLIHRLSTTLRDIDNCASSFRNLLGNVRGGKSM
jgi:hypothetical protein